MIRPASALVALLLAIGIAGEAECADRLELGRGLRKAGDPLIEAMDGAAARAGMDGIILVSIASVVEDAQQMRLSRALNVQTAGTGSRSAVDDGERGGMYGFEEQAWLKAAAPLVAVARSDERPDVAKTKIPRRNAGDASARRQILDMRRDPVFSTQVAATALKAGIPVFHKALGREPSAGELLIMHLFGPEAAVRVTRAALKDAVTLCTAPLGEAAKRPSVRLFVTTTTGAMLTARALAVTAEVAMATKAKIAHRFLDRLRAANPFPEDADA